MDFDFTTSPYALYSGLATALILFFRWRHNRIKSKKSASKSTEPSYSTAQLFGIAGIILFLLPFLFTSMSYLARGTLLLMFFIFNFFPLSGWVRILFHSIAIASCYFMMFAGTYFICEQIWPKKNQNIKKADS